MPVLLSLRKPVRRRNGGVQNPVRGEQFFGPKMGASPLRFCVFPKRVPWEPQQVEPRKQTRLHGTKTQRSAGVGKAVSVNIAFAAKSFYIRTLTSICPCVPTYKRSRQLRLCPRVSREISRPKTGAQIHSRARVQTKIPISTSSSHRSEF